MDARATGICLPRDAYNVIKVLIEEISTCFPEDPPSEVDHHDPLPVLTAWKGVCALVRSNAWSGAMPLGSHKLMRTWTSANFEYCL